LGDFSNGNLSSRTATQQTRTGKGSKVLFILQSLHHTCVTTREGEGGAGGNWKPDSQGEPLQAGIRDASRFGHQTIRVGGDGKVGGTSKWVREDLISKKKDLLRKLHC